MTPRVTYDGDIILEITIENSARGQDSNIAGQNLPSFFSRKVSTKLRLRDGESNLLAGLLREDERKSLTGFPGIMRLPIVKQLFSNNDSTDSADRHRDAADAAHHAHARSEGVGPEPDLHRHAEQHGADRTAGDDWRRRPNRSRRRQPPPPARRHAGHAARYQAARRAGTARRQRAASR